MKKHYFSVTYPSRMAGFFLLLLLPLFYVSCKKGGDKNDEQEGPYSTGTIKGLGSSTERPEGPELLLPTGVKLLSVMAYDETNKKICGDKEEKEMKGHGIAVRLCLAFQNTTGAPVTITFPPGLIFISKSIATQNGVLVQGFTVEVPPAPVFYQPIGLVCANPSRTPSVSSEIIGVDEFETTPILTANKKLLEFCKLVSQKQIPSTRATDLPSIEINGCIQSSVWRIGNGEAVDEDCTKKLQALPNR